MSRLAKIEVFNDGTPRTVVKINGTDVPCKSFHIYQRTGEVPIADMKIYCEPTIVLNDTDIFLEETDGER